MGEGIGFNGLKMKRNNGDDDSENDGFVAAIDSMMDSVVVDFDFDDYSNDGLLEIPTSEEVEEEDAAAADYNNIIELPLTPDIIEQEIENANRGTSSIGLKLRKSSSFQDFVQMKLFEAAGVPIPMSLTHKSRTLKSVNLSASSLEIGTWKMESKYESDLVAKCYYGKRKLIWEILNRDGLKSKMEILWSDILSIQADGQENQPGILAIELNQPPSFFQETNPQPRKHTNWKITTDFTQNYQASTCRRHILTFPTGSYLDMIESNERLFDLSKRAFPSLESPYFHGNIFPSPQFSFESNPPQHALSIPQGQHYHRSIIPMNSFPHHQQHHHHQVQPFQQMPNGSSFCINESPSPMSAMDASAHNHVHENRMNAMYGPVMQNNNHVHENRMNAMYSPVMQSSSHGHGNQMSAIYDPVRQSSNHGHGNQMSAIYDAVGQSSSHVHGNQMSAIYDPAGQSSSHGHGNQMSAIYDPVGQNSNHVHGNQMSAIYGPVGQNSNHVHENQRSAIYGPVGQNSNHEHENQRSAMYGPVRQNSNAVFVGGNQPMITSEAAQASTPFSSSTLQQIDPTLFLNQRSVPSHYEGSSVGSSSQTHGNFQDIEHHLMVGDLQVDCPDKPRVLSKVESMYNPLQGPMEANAAANVAAAGATSQTGFNDAEIFNAIGGAFDHLYAPNGGLFLQPHNCTTSNFQGFVENLPMQTLQNTSLYPNEFQASGMQNFGHVGNGMPDYGHVGNGMPDYGQVREGMQDYRPARQGMQDYGPVRNLDVGNNYQGYR